MDKSSFSSSPLTLSTSFTKNESNYRQNFSMPRFRFLNPIHFASFRKIVKDEMESSHWKNLFYCHWTNLSPWDQQRIRKRARKQFVLQCKRTCPDYELFRFGPLFSVFFSFFPSFRTLSAASLNCLPFSHSSSPQLLSCDNCIRQWILLSVCFLISIAQWSLPRSSPLVRNTINCASIYYHFISRQRSSHSH